MRSDLEEGKVWFINYAALDPTAVKVEDLDLHNAGMLPGDVEQFAHLWLAHSRSIDINHDGVGRAVFVLESFFNGPDIASAAWPINSHATRLDISQSEEAMTGMQDGSLNSVSLDAYTFNRVVRLPVAEAKSMLGIREVLKSAPGTLDQWALEMAQRGYPGVLGVTQVRPGLYVAQRSHGMPLAITFKDGQIEAASGGGAWGQVAVALCESGSMVQLQPQASAPTPVPTVNTIDPAELPPSQGGAQSNPVDFGRWDPAMVDQMLRAEGLLVGVPLTQQIEGDERKQLEHELFAALLEETVGTEPSQVARQMVLQGVSVKAAPHGLLPHHSMVDGKMHVSKEAVLTGMSKLHLLPNSTLRDKAKRHLLHHLAEIAGQDDALKGALEASELSSVPQASQRRSSGIFVGSDPPSVTGGV